MKVFVKDMVKKAPKPDELDDYGDDAPDAMSEPGEDDEDGDMAAQRSAMEDFIGAVGGDAKNAGKALELFKELIGYCK